jgi:hypothetical protein
MAEHVNPSRLFPHLDLASLEGVTRVSLHTGADGVRLRAGSDGSDVEGFWSEPSGAGIGEVIGWSVYDARTDGPLDEWLDDDE